jgi:tetratricopeptide (TPR) repeat protein
LLSAGLGWWLTPLQGKFRAIAVPLLEPIVLGVKNTQGFHARSIGAVLLGIAAVAMLLILLRAHRRIFFWLGAAVAAICLSFTMHIVFRDVSSVDALLDQRDQAKSINSFSQQYLRGVSSFLQPDKELTTDTLLDRVSAVNGFLGFGYWAALGGGVLLMAGAFRKRGGRPLLPDALLLLVAGGAFAGFYAARGVQSERHREAADRSLARGRYAEALEGYAAAAGGDPNLGFNQSFAYNVGSAAWALHRTDLPEYHVYLGDNLLSTKDYEGAEAEYDRAAALAGNPALIAKKRIVTRMRAGLSHYSHGRTQDAVTSWSRTLEVDPGQVAAYFFLTKAYVDVDGRDQTKAIGMGNTVLDITGEKLIRGDTYNLLGDAYYKQRDYQKAREMYKTSNEQFIMVKKIINFESMKGLQGI